MKYWIWAEDLVAAMIGPFDTREEAEAHIKFCEDRGDGAEMKVINGVEADYMDPNMVLTPEQDKKWGSQEG